MKDLPVQLPVLVRQNPFKEMKIPEKVYWSASSIKLWRQCKRKWFWKYVARVEPKAKSGYLIIGTAFHEALEEWYRMKRVGMNKIALKHAGAARNSIQQNGEFYNDSQLDKFMHQAQILQGMLMGYGEMYREDRKNWDINRKAIEVPFEVDYGDYAFVGKIDLHVHRLLSEKRKRPFVVEHKTAAKIDAGYIDRLPVDTQIRGYALGATKGLQLPTTSILYDVVAKTKIRRKSGESVQEYNDRISLEYQSKPGKYFYREPLKFKKSHVEALEWKIYQIHKEYEYICSNMEFFDDPNPAYFIPNDGSCYNYNTTCPYLLLCTVGLDRGTAMAYKERSSTREETDEV